jgi:hypothetical protein
MGDLTAAIFLVLYSMTVGAVDKEFLTPTLEVSSRTSFFLLQVIPFQRLLHSQIGGYG